MDLRSCSFSGKAFPKDKAPDASQGVQPFKGTRNFTKVFKYFVFYVFYVFKKYYDLPFGNIFTLKSSYGHFLYFLPKLWGRKFQTPPAPVAPPV